MNKTIINAVNITKIYNLDTSHPLKAIKDISLEVSEGEFVCIMGQSGSGKSTLLNNISSIDKPTLGKLFIDGKEISTMSEREIGRFRYENLGFIFQNYNLLEALSIYENIAMPLILQECEQDEIEKRVFQVCQQLKIDDLLEKFPSECSGGQKQRTAIARALVTKPKIIIADEPTGNLDSKNSHELLSLLKDLNEKDKIAIVMVTHDTQIASYSSKLLLIKDGKINHILERKDMSQKDYFYKIVDITSKEYQQLFL